jgi:alkyldihydroxyacetonephosphate synthase
MNRRWNGWGNPQTEYPLPESARQYLERFMGTLASIPDAPYQDVLRQVPASGLPAHPGIDLRAQTRLAFARGQSLPDWIDLRYGRIRTFPDGVACPPDVPALRELIQHAYRQGWRIIPYGGGTSVVGHINPLPGDAPVLTISLEKLNRLVALDEHSRLATFEAGIPGPLLEESLAARSYTLGHFPQSFELSTLGGWIATRSSGQQSYYYGRIEELFAGGEVETAVGTLTLPPLPASAAGPDLRQLVLGSEGRLGVITRATVRIHPTPKAEGFYAVFFPDWQAGLAAVRAIAQTDLPLSMLRLSNAVETETTQILSGKSSLVAWARRGLGMLGYSDERCLLIFGVTGPADQIRRTRGAVQALCRAARGLPTGEFIGRMWRKSRFLTPYLRNTLWEAGIAIDTLETALPWSQVDLAAERIQKSIQEAAAERGEQALVFAHLSHVYTDGASLYITYLFRRSPSPDVTTQLWQAMKSAASREIVGLGGTISHQHGVGTDHAPYLAAEKSAPGMQILEQVFHAADPKQLLNPGKLIPTPATQSTGDDETA